MWIKGGRCCKKIPMPCYVENISASGAMVFAKSAFEVGDWVYLMGMRLLPEEKPFAFTCIVRLQKAIVKKG